VEFVVGSVTDHDLLSELFDRHRFRYVYHLAAYAAEGLSHFIRRFNYTINVIGSVNVINEAVRQEVECLVFTSSNAVYGAAAPPMREDEIPHPEDPYGVANLAVELDLAAARSMFGLRSVIFRPHNVYGEYQNLGDPYRNVIGIFMNQIMQGKAMSVFGDGTQQRALAMWGTSRHR
jgi:UDP-glucose 4-epimerase